MKTNKDKPVRIHSETVAVAMTHELEEAIAKETVESTTEEEDTKKLQEELEALSIRGLGENPL